MVSSCPGTIPGLHKFVTCIFAIDKLLAITSLQLVQGLQQTVSLPANRKGHHHAHLPHCLGRWTKGVLSGGRRPEGADRAATARLSHLLAHVPRTHSGTCRSLPCGGAGFAWLRLH